MQRIDTNCGISLLWAFALVLASVPEGAIAQTGPAPVFGRDVAPVLVARCLECHSAARKSGGFSMETFETLRTGGDSGPAWLAGKSAESTILRKVRGLDPPRMPRNRPPLGNDTIDRIAAWVDAGAKLDDGRNPADSLDSIAWPESRIVAEQLGRMVPEDRAKAARNEAAKRFAAVRPVTAKADEATIRTTERFVVIGLDDREVAESLLKSLEKVQGELKSILGNEIAIPGVSGPPFLVFVFGKPAEFAEFGRQNGFEGVAPNQSAMGLGDSAWPMLALTVTKDNLAATDATRPERKRGGSSRRKRPGEAPVAAVRGVDSMGAEAYVDACFDLYPKTPGWLRTGLALALAQGFEDDPSIFDAMFTEARASGPARVTGDWSRRADEFLNGRLPADVSRPLAFALVTWLKTKWPGEFPRFVRELSAGGQELDNTIRTLWNTDRATFVANWTESLLRGPTRKGRR